MRRAAVSIACFALAVSAAAPVMAAPPGGSAAPSANAQRVVMYCEAGAIARRNFEREHGQAPVFITADQAMRAVERRETWTTPRCMNAREHARLSRTVEARKTRS